VDLYHSTKGQNEYQLQEQHADFEEDNTQHHDFSRSQNQQPITTLMTQEDEERMHQHQL
jgi:hypothetical protein